MSTSEESGGLESRTADEAEEAGDAEDTSGAAGADETGPAEEAEPEEWEGELLEPDAGWEEAEAEPVGRIVSLVPAEPGWRAVYGAEFAEDRELARVVAWALVESDEGERRIVGMVIDPNDPTRVVPAPEAASPVAGFFERYGFKER
jgi:hypothetical protein